MPVSKVSVLERVDCIINAAFSLVELLLGYMLWPTSSEKSRLFGGKKGLNCSFKLTNLLNFTKTIIPLALMAAIDSEQKLIRG